MYVSFQVQVPPAWIEQPISVEGIEQDVAKFYCEAAGTPNPTYTWVNWEGINVLDKEGCVAFHKKRISIN